MTQERNVRVRFAPSPTGYLHIGNARTAFFNYLFALKNQGTLVLRIEDTDVERSEENYVEAILEDLKWLGINWTEGPDCGGAYGPYRQSQRTDIYNKYLEKLKEQKRIYPCFCTPEELDVRRTEAVKSGASSRYDNRCRHLTQEECHNFQTQGKPFVLRFKMPDTPIVVDDLIRGKVTFDSDQMGDFVIVKSDGGVTFHLAVVVDDIEMKISHIIRGEDHLSNTPRHCALFEALGASLPQFAHMSMTLGPDGARLSKRHGAASVAEYRRLGYLPEALRNYLALLGWSPGDDREIMALDEMAEAFSMKRMTKSAAIFGKDKLDWMNGMYIRQKPAAELTRLAIPFLQEKGYFPSGVDESNYERLVKVKEGIRNYLNVLSDYSEHAQIYLADELNYNDEALSILGEESSRTVLGAFVERAQSLQDWTGDNFQQILMDVQKETGIKGKELYGALRVALTGKPKGPELKIVAPILGKDKTLLRFRHCIKKGSPL